MQTAVLLLYSEHDDLVSGEEDMGAAAEDGDGAIRGGVDIGSKDAASPQPGVKGYWSGMGKGI